MPKGVYMAEIDFYSKSMKAIAKWIKESKRVGYKKNKCSSYEGFFYEKNDEYTGRNVTFDIKLTKDGTVIFEAYPGIHIVHEAFVPAVSVYCQKIETLFGVVYADVEKGHIEYRIGTCILDNPLSVETLTIFEFEAMRVLRMHHDNLSDLAAGKFVSIEPAIELPVKNNCMKLLPDVAVAGIKDYLINKSGYNAVYESVDGSDETVLSGQLISGNACFRIDYHVSEDGILTMKAFHGENDIIVPDEYVYSAATYLNSFNTCIAQGDLHIGDKNEGYNCSIYTSLLDGPVGEKTITYLERILINTLDSAIESVETLCSDNVFSFMRSEGVIDSTTKRISDSDENDQLTEMLRGVDDAKESLEEYLDRLFEEDSCSEKSTLKQFFQKSKEQNDPEKEDELIDEILDRIDEIFDDE